MLATIGLEILTPLASWRAFIAPDAIVTVPVPKAELLPALMAPALMLVPPLYVLTPLRVSVPAPAWTRLTVPVVFRIEPLNVLLFVETPEVPMVSVGLPPAVTSSILPFPDNALMVGLLPFRSRIPGLEIFTLELPNAPPTPNWRVPLVMFVKDIVLAWSTFRMPVPDCSSVPVPLIRLVRVTGPSTSKFSVPLVVTVPV